MSAGFDMAPIDADILSAVERHPSIWANGLTSHVLGTRLAGKPDSSVMERHLRFMERIGWVSTMQQADLARWWITDDGRRALVDYWSNHPPTLIQAAHAAVDSAYGMRDGEGIGIPLRDPHGRTRHEWRHLREALERETAGELHR